MRSIFLGLALCFLSMAAHAAPGTFSATLTLNGSIYGPFNASSSSCLDVQTALKSWLRTQWGGVEPQFTGCSSDPIMNGSIVTFRGWDTNHPFKIGGLTASPNPNPTVEELQAQVSFMLGQLSRANEQLLIANQQISTLQAAQDTVEPFDPQQAKQLFFAGMFVVLFCYVTALGVGKAIQIIKGRFGGY